MTTPDIQQAKEWAESRAYGNYVLGEETLAAVKVIQSLPDQIVDGRRLQEIIDFQGTSISEEARKDLESLIPAPAPRTLADMSLEELQGYIGGEVMVDGWANPTMLVSVIVDEGAVLARRLNKPWPFVEVRPLSDLTPVAVSEQKAESTPDDVAYATGGTLTTQDVVDECRAVRKERSLPRPEDVPPGEAWMMKHESWEWIGLRSKSQSCPWSITRIDGMDYRDVADSDITLISRLVPQYKENA